MKLNSIRSSVRAKTAVALYFFAQIFFLICIQFPTKVNFDEFHYVPAAKEILSFHRVPNTEHPPLGKWIMAAGIGLFGDRPIGWRVMSTIFGAMTLVGMYMWGHALFKREDYARWIAAITLVNSLLYVQSRIGMLDTFMCCFLVWALVFFTEAWDSKASADFVRKRLRYAGILFGFATACKWFAVMPWFACIALSALIFTFKHWGVSFAKPKKGDIQIGTEDWYTPDLWNGVRGRDIVVSLVIIPWIPYFLTFFPYFFFEENTLHFTDLLSLQVRMWGDQLRVVSSHPYMSQWKDWPLLTRPIWYAFDSEPEHTVRGVLLLGNPLMMWSGLVALLLCFWGWIRFRSREAFLILFFYAVLYGSWVIIPRKIAFYYYYYPAGMVLSLALAYVAFHFEKLMKADAQYRISIVRWGFFVAFACVFVYFFPILAGLKIQAEEFRHWMWFNSWI